MFKLKTALKSSLVLFLHMPIHLLNHLNAFENFSLLGNPQNNLKKATATHSKGYSVNYKPLKLV